MPLTDSAPSESARKTKVQHKDFSQRLGDLCHRIAFPDIEIVYGTEACADSHPIWFLRVHCAGLDNETKRPLNWTGRKWRLSTHMTDGEIVQTAFLAILTALEHEAREKFKFDGVSVFDPHYDIHKLVELRRQSDAIQERS